MDTHIPINQWAEDDRPREKLLSKGRHALSNAELLAILINTGTRDKSALEVAKDVLRSADDDLNELAKLSIIDLQKTKGMGEAKAVIISAALELGRRRRSAEVNEKTKISNSNCIYELFHAQFDSLNVEEFWILLLNRANIVIRKERISHGGISGTVADPKIILKKALEAEASSMALCHNHPSGNTRPSEEDKRITRKIKEACILVDILLLDHVIFTDKGYFSFADEGEL